MDDIKNMLSASKEHISVTIIKKDFSKQKLTKIDLSDSLFNNVKFSSCDLYGCIFKSSDFVSCDFSNSSFLNIRFKDCSFIRCIFDNSTLQDTVFDNCKKLKCSLNNLTLQDGVSGIDETDMKIITETENREKLKHLISNYNQFVCSSPDEYVLSEDNNDSKFIIVYDQENESYRFMAMLEDNIVISDTLDITNQITDDEFRGMCRDVLKAAELKLRTSNDDKDAVKFTNLLKALLNNDASSMF